MAKTQIGNRKLGIRIEMDTEQIFPSDPGQGTPVLVCTANGGTASWNCAVCEGETDEGPMTEEEKRWLEEHTPQVEAWMQKHGV